MMEKSRSGTQNNVEKYEKTTTLKSSNQSILISRSQVVSIWKHRNCHEIASIKKYIKVYKSTTGKVKDTHDTFYILWAFTARLILLK